MGRMVVLAYKPHPGKETEVRQLIREHRQTLLTKGLVTDMTPVHMKSESGVIVEVFEWRADEAVQEARLDSSVSSLWQAFDSVADFVRLADLQECQDPFANFDRIHLLDHHHHHHSRQQKQPHDPEPEQPALTGAAAAGGEESSTSSA